MNDNNSNNQRKDVAESARVAQEIWAVPQHCYDNASRVIEDVPGYESADYVEGYAIYKSHSIEHGWVEKNGVIVDPTLPRDVLTYIPGLRFTGRTGLEEAKQIPKPKHTSKDFPIFYRFGWAGQEHPEMKAAWAAVRRHIENVERGFEESEPKS